MDNTIIAALTGVTGIAVGAWLNSLLTLRRERWNLARELYTRLLENLMEAEDALEKLLPNAAVRQETDEDKEHEKRLNDNLSKALAELRRAEAISGILLSQEALDALARLHEEQRAAGRTTNYMRWLDGELFAVKRAYRLVLEAAKRQLGPAYLFRIWRGESKLKAQAKDAPARKS